MKSEAILNKIEGKIDAITAQLLAFEPGNPQSIASESSRNS
jgi:hypothetical protein